MQNMPNITVPEVAVVCTAALLLCVLPNLIVWSDSRRLRRRQREEAQQAARAVQAAQAAQASMERHALDSSLNEAPIEAATLVETTGVNVGEPASEAAPVSAQPVLSEQPVLEDVLVVKTAAAVVVIEEAPVSPAPASPVLETADAAPSVHRDAPTETAICELHLDELRRVKLPNWPPAEVRDDVARKRVWDEALRVSEQAVITSMAFKSPRKAESACLASADSQGSVLTLRFLLFSELWPVAADQATAEATFELDSGSGEVQATVRSL